MLAVTINNPWIVNDRVADTHNLNTMAATYVNAYTPNGVVAPANNQDKAINIYNNQKRRLYHWADEPPNVGGNDINDPTYNQNVFGWGLCGRHACQGCTIANAIGFGERKIAVPGDWQMEFIYDGGNHLFHTMMTFYVMTGVNMTGHIAGCDEIQANNNLVLNAVADNRACPGFLLCGDTAAGEVSMVNHYSDGGDAAVTTRWTGNMNIRTGEVFYRSWQSLANEFPTPYTDADGYSGPDSPYHHEANKDYKDWINIPYWEPYQLTSAQSVTVNIPMIPTYRRWANGTDTVTPDFRSVNYQDLLYSSTNIATYYTDGVTPDLHANTVGTLAEAVFQVQFPFYLTDGAISGTFTRTNSSDITAIYTSPDGSSWTQVWNNTATGQTVLSNLSLRNQVFGNWNQFFIKVQIQSTSAKTDAGVTGLTFNITYEHNKGAMAYLDNGVNHLTFTCDNASALGSGYRIKLDYKWKEYDGSDWTIDKAYTKYISTSPTNITLVTGGASRPYKRGGVGYDVVPPAGSYGAVPRTEYIQMTIVPTPPADTTPPAAISNLACGTAGRTTMPLTWTAPGNDGNTGEATGYDLRYSTSAITAGNFSSATQVANVPFPRPAGGAESFTVTGLTAGTTYYFAIKAYDDAGNYATISNVPSQTTMAADTQAPNAVANLAAAPQSTYGTWNITWTAPSDNGNGYVASYDLRWSTSAITAGNFSSASQISGIGTPKSGGQAEAYTATGLPTGKTLYFAIKSADDSNNWSAISNLPSNSQMIGTLVLQNGLTVNGSTYSGAQDTYMDASAVTTKYDGTTYLQIAGNGGGTNRRRPIVEFSLSCLPTNSLISQATLYLYAYTNEGHDASGGYYGAYHVFTTWSAPAVSWNMPWVQYGGSDIDTLDGQTAKQTTSNVWYAIDVTSRVQSFLTGSANNGWTIKCTDESKMNQDWFYACEYTGDPTLRPKLVLVDVPDTTPPAAVTNLATSSPTGNSITLSWTAPGDDGNTGTATTYDIRYATSQITNDTQFNAATHCTSGVPAPATAGTNQNYTVTGLSPTTTYYFAMKTADEVPNWSTISNSPSGTTTALDVTPPAAVSNLATSSPTPGSITLTWTAPGDDGNSGTATTYDIRYATSQITNDTQFNAATHCTSGVPAPQVAGTNQSYTVPGLSPTTTYYFAMKTADEVPNWSTISNSPSGTTTAPTIRTVGSGYTYSTIQAAHDASNDWDTIQVYGGPYVQSAGWATLTKNHLTIIGMGSSRVVLDAAGSAKSSKGIFIADGTDLTVQNLEFKNTTTTSGYNAAGIRLEAPNLTVTNCYFHDNDDGILTNNGVAGTILIEYSEFNHNGYGDGSSHNMYINPVDSFTLRYCYCHNANVGHEVKTRGLVNYILYNRIGNEGGNGSYEVDVPQGGTTYIIGNQIEQSSTSSNSRIITYAEESTANPDQHLYVVNNTIVNNMSSGTFVNNGSGVSALLENNIFQGTGTVLSGSGTQTTNWATSNAYLVSPSTYDFHLTSGSTGALDLGTTPGTGINGFNMNPTLQYVHPCSYQSRSPVGTIDIGAYEYGTSSQPSVQFTSSTGSGSESVTSVNIPVSLSASSSSTVTVNYAVTGGTATGGGVDYTLASGQLTFSPGITSQNIPMTVVDDSLNEANETVIVTLSNPTNATLGTNTTYTYTIIDNDPAPTVQFTSATGSGSESVTSVNIPVSLNTASGQTVTVNYAVTGGTATGGGVDYTLASGQLTFTAGVTSQNIAMTVVDDAIAEANETVIVTLSSPTNATLGTNTTYTYTIIDNDSAPTVQFNLTSSQGSENTSAVNLAVSLSAASGQTVTVNYAVTGGTAVQGVDYTISGTSLTFSPGITSQNIPITIMNDGLYGPGDTIIVTLSSPTNATLGANTTHTYTIVEVDSQPTVQFSSSTGSGSESVTSVTIPVTLSEGSELTTTVQYAVTGGTATGGGVDYTLNSGTLTFNPGVTSQNISMTVVNDTLHEANETVVVTLTSPSNATLGTNTTYTYTINDDDAAPTVQFSSATGSGSESVTSVTIPVTLSAASGMTTTVNYAVTGGTATGGGVDYTLASGQLTFSPGITTQNISMTVVDDSLVEGNETVIVTLSSPTNATLGTNTTYTYTIIDNDVAAVTVQFQATSSSGSESVTPANIVVTLSQASAQTVTVTYNVTGGTATQGTDYTLPTGSTGGIYALKRSAGLTDTSRLDSRFVTAIGNSTIVVNTGQDMAADTDFWTNTGWAASNCYGNYGGAAGMQYGALFFLSKFKTSSLSGFSGSTINMAQVRYYYPSGNTGLTNLGYVTSSDWIEGTGTTDGYFPGAAGGASFAHPQGHNTGANQDTNGGTTGPMQSWANNDYFGVTKDVSALTVTAGPHNAGADFIVYDVTQIVQLWANGTPNYGFCIYDTGCNYPVQYSETTAGATYQPTLFIDYSGSVSSNTVTFAPGVTSMTIPITIINDSLNEANETIQLTLSNPTNATLGTNTVTTYTINDDDAAPTVQFNSATGSGSESVTSVNIPVSLNTASGQTVTVNYAVTGGTATGGGVDYTLASGQLTFTAGVTSQNIAMTVVNDTLHEANETVIVTLSSPTNATLGTNTTYTYTINDDDAAPTVQFSSATGSGSESVTTVNIPVTLSAASGMTTTVNYAATGGTATGGGVDYTLAAGQLTFNPGVTSQNIVMTVVDDSIAELSETVIITLSSPTNATLGTNTTYTYTILDNDTPAMPTFVAAGAVASGTGAITPALPSGLQTNDILLLFLETANQTISISNQNGGTWTQVTGSPQGTGTAGGSSATCLTAFWSRYNGTQGAPTTSDSGDHQLGRMIAIRGATQSGNPWDVTAGGVSSTSSTSASIPGATTTVANDLVVVAIATSLPDASGTANFSGWTNANLSSLTERTDNTVTAGNGGGLGLATGGKATAGAYGSTTVTLANSATKGMMSIAIVPYIAP